MIEGRPTFEGRLAVGMGTGNYRDRRGRAEVEICNPKRWSIDT